MIARDVSLCCCSVVGVIFAAGGVANAASIRAHAVADFWPGAFAGDSSNNPHADSFGSGTWTYASSLTSNPTDGGANMTTLSWDTGCVIGGNYDMNALDGICTYPTATRMIGQAGIRLHPAFSRFAVSRWTAGAGEAGPVLITGNFRKADILGFGDGVEVWIYVDGTECFYQEISNENDVGFDFNILVEVLVGSTIDFVVGHNGPDRNGAPPIDADTTFLSAAVIACPTDINGDGVTNVLDLIILLLEFGQSCP